MIILETAEMLGIGIINKEIEKSIEEISARIMTTNTTVNISKHPLGDILNRINRIIRLTRKPFAVSTANKTKGEGNVYIDLWRVSTHYVIFGNSVSSLIDDSALKVFTIKLI